MEYVYEFQCQTFLIIHLNKFHVVFHENTSKLKKLNQPKYSFKNELVTFVNSFNWHKYIRL